MTLSARLFAPLSGLPSFIFFTLELKL